MVRYFVSPFPSKTFRKLMYFPEDDILHVDEPLACAPVARHAVWDDLRKDYVHTYGIPPSEPTDFIAFLKRLRPSECGRVECPPCRMNYDGELDLHTISDHFRYCHVGNISMADKGDLKPRVWAAINHLMRDSEGRQIIMTLRDRCSDISKEYLERKSALAQTGTYKPNLPSVIIFLSQQRVSCDGQLVCIGPKCKGLERFEASWDALKLHYESIHAEHLLKDDQVRYQLDVNSHLAGHNRSINRLLEKAQNRYNTWSLMDDDAKEAERASDAWHIENEASIYRRLPGMSQFGVLRDLKKMFRSRHRKFFRLVAESSSREISSFAEKLRAECPSPADLRRLGTQTFRRVVGGITPTTLLETFAFITLSEAMTTVMRRRGVQVTFDPHIVDYFAWRTSIKDEAEHVTYDQLLMAWFHPRWQSEHGMSPLSNRSIRRNSLTVTRSSRVPRRYHLCAGGDEKDCHATHEG